jgi:hypothetical protein
MKTIRFFTFAALILLGGSASETNFIHLTPIALDAATNNLDPIITTNRDTLGVPIAIDAAKRRALRAYFEKLPSVPFARDTDAGFYDLTDVWKLLIDSGFDAWRIPVDMQTFVLEGKIFEVVPDGVLVSENRSGLIFLKNYSSQKRVVDGDEIRVLGVRSGRYSYTSVSGGTRTIPKMDCGTSIKTNTIPEEIIRVTIRGKFKIRRP